MVKYINLQNIYDFLNEKLNFLDFYDKNAEISLIFDEILKLDLKSVFAYPEKRIDFNKFEKIKKIAEKRSNRQPLAYILNRKDFFGLRFYVNRDVLIPRNETELVVEEAINQIKEKKRSVSCIDLGTGSGNIFISILKNTYNTSFYAVDISKKALGVAKKNAKIHSVQEKVKFVQTDKLEYFLRENIKVDFIISNPPYVSSKEYKNLQKEITFEPKSALLDKSGVGFYKYIAGVSDEILLEEGKLIMEINSNLVNEIKEIFIKKSFVLEKIINDYYSLPRVMVFKIGD